jgi:mono/diheme cytochrome c family protein
MALVLSAPANAQSPLDRGAYLVNSIAACGSCHTPRGPEDSHGNGSEERLAGGLEFKTPTFTAYSTNITPDPATGIGRWTDSQIITAIRDGRRPDGSLIRPPMPVDAYRQMSDQDAKAIVAYLRSVPPVNKTAPPSVYHMPLPQGDGHPIGYVAAVSPRNPVLYGRYLATIGHCLECHTPMGQDGRRAYRSALGAGSVEFDGPWGVSVSADITPRGLAHFSDAQLGSIITTGLLPSGMRLKPPMPYAYYARMTPSDLHALIAFLRALPAR